MSLKQSHKSLRKCPCELCVRAQALGAPPPSASSCDWCLSISSAPLGKLLLPSLLSFPKPSLVLPSAISLKEMRVEAAVPGMAEPLEQSVLPAALLPGHPLLEGPQTLLTPAQGQRGRPRLLQNTSRVREGMRGAGRAGIQHSRDPAQQLQELIGLRGGSQQEMQGKGQKIQRCWLGGNCWERRDPGLEKRAQWPP